MYMMYCECQLVGNKDDNADKKAVPTSDGRRFADQLAIPFFETSAMENRNIEEVTFK